MTSKTSSRKDARRMRRSARAVALRAKKSPSKGEAPPKVLSISEIRQDILSRLDRSDLLTFMRVQKECMPDVARLVYRTITGKRAQFGLNRNTTELISQPRSRIYCDAVREIDAHSIIAAARRAHLPHERLKGLQRNDSYAFWQDETEYESEAESDSGTDSSRSTRSASAGYGHITYLPSTFNLIIPTLRRRFPYLRKITFGDQETLGEDDAWIVHFEPAYDEGIRFTSPSTLLGHIDVISTININLSVPPTPQSIIPPIPSTPSSSYSLHHRYDLDLTSYRHAGAPLFLDEWLAVLHTQARLGDLHTGIYLGKLPVDLSFLTNLYQRQAENGHHQRLSHVIAPQTNRWNIRDFQTFGILSGSSLTALTLYGGRREIYQPDRIGITFMDLPNLTILIRYLFPSLKHLHVAMRGIETAEMELANKLQPHCLESRGTIDNLRILTDECDTELFNTLRILSQVCVADATIDVVMGNDGAGQVKLSRAQTFFHMSLRTESLLRRHHLATADFDQLGLWSLAQVQLLTYDDYGRPQPL